MPATRERVMVPPARTGKSSARAAVNVRSTLASPRVGIALLIVGGLCLLSSVLTGLCRVQPVLAYLSAGMLMIAALGIGIGWPWARMLGRVIAWLNVFLLAMLVVPDWDDAVLTGSQGLHIVCGMLAVYFLLCAITLGLRK